MPITVGSVHDLAARIGQELGPSEWRTLSQGEVDAFGALVRDMAWIHCDPAAAAKGPYGRTIVHGFLTLGLVPAMLGELLTFQGSAVNYGTNRIRFPAPWLVGTAARLRAWVKSVHSVKLGSIQTEIVCTLETPNDSTPVLYVDLLVRFAAMTAPQ